MSNFRLVQVLFIYIIYIYILFFSPTILLHVKRLKCLILLSTINFRIYINVRSLIFVFSGEKVSGTLGNLAVMMQRSCVHLPVYCYAVA